MANWLWRIDCGQSAYGEMTYSQYRGFLCNLVLKISGCNPLRYAVDNSNSSLDLSRLNGLLYRAQRNVHKKIHWRAVLDLIGRARPITWPKYLLANTPKKAITRGLPLALSVEMQKNIFMERRRPGRPKFYDNSRGRIGRQALRNRLGIINNFGFDWSYGLTGDSLGTNLKKVLGMKILDCRLHWFLYIFNFITYVLPLF